MSDQVRVERSVKMTQKLSNRAKTAAALLPCYNALNQRSTVKYIYTTGTEVEADQATHLTYHANVNYASLRAKRRAHHAASDARRHRKQNIS